MSYQVHYTDRSGNRRESPTFGARDRAEEFAQDLNELPNNDLGSDRLRLPRLLARVVDLQELAMSLSEEE